MEQTKTQWGVMTVNFWAHTTFISTFIFASVICWILFFHLFKNIYIFSFQKHLSSWGNVPKVMLERFGASEGRKLLRKLKCLFHTSFFWSPETNTLYLPARYPKSVTLYWWWWILSVQVKETAKILVNKLFNRNTQIRVSCRVEKKKKKRL